MITTITLTAKQKRFFRHARHMAEMSDFRRAQVGCIAVIGNKVVATGFSQHKTHPLQKYYNQFRDFDSQIDVVAKMHAEGSLLFTNRFQNIQWDKADVYIYRICRSRPSGMAKPCPSCEQAMRAAHIKNVYFSTDDGFGYEKLS